MAHAQNHSTRSDHESVPLHVCIYVCVNVSQAVIGLLLHRRQ